MKIEISGDLRREWERVSPSHLDQIKNALAAREMALLGNFDVVPLADVGKENVIQLSSRPGVIIPAIVAAASFVTLLFTTPR